MDPLCSIPFPPGPTQLTLFAFVLFIFSCSILLTNTEANMTAALLLLRSITDQSVATMYVYLF